MPGLFNGAVLTSNVMMKMNSELDGMWKEMVMASLRNYLSTHPSWRTEQNSCQD
jgi:hypothetical protein